VTTLGNFNKPTWGIIEDAGGSGNNQKALAVTAPSAGQITRLGAWFFDYAPALDAPNWTYQLCVWNAGTGALLAHSATMTSTAFAIARLEADLTSPLAVTEGQALLIGWARASSKYIAYAVGASGSGTHYEKTQSSWPGSMSGAGSQPYKMGCYAYLTVVSKPLKPLTESYGVV